MRHFGLGTYVLLTLLAILSPTPLPVPLDGIVVGLIKFGFNVKIVLFLTIVGNLLGTLLVYFFGSKSRDFVNKHKAKKKKKINIFADDLFKKHGKFALLLSGIPFLGDALIFVSGFYKINVFEFFLYFILGKIIWYLLLTLGVLAI